MTSGYIEFAKMPRHKNWIERLDNWLTQQLDRLSEWIEYQLNI